MHAASPLATFFSRLSIPQEQYLETRLIVPDAPGARQHFCKSTSEAVAIATRASGTANVYVSACPRSRRNGTREAVTTVSGAWADLDFHLIDPTDRDVALELAYSSIETLGMLPTMLVHTGNGLHAWWLFHQPAAISAEWPAKRFESINIGLAQRLGGDHVHDLGRVLRVPGTMNLPTAKKRERGCVPVMARLLDANGPTYRPEDFKSLAARPPTSVPLARPVLSAATQPGGEIVTAFERLLVDLGPAHPLVRTWRGVRAPRDTSRSGWDWLLVRELQRIGMREEFIPSVVRAFPLGRGSLATELYLARTIQKTQVYWRGVYESKQPLEA